MKIVPVVLGLVVTGSAVCLGYYRAHSRKLDLERLKAIKSYSPETGSKLVKIADLWVFPVGETKIANSFAISKQLNCADKDLESLYYRLRSRFSYLADIESTDRLQLAGSVSYDIPGKPQRICAFEFLGVEAIKVVDSNGESKLRAIGPIGGLGIGHADPGHPIPYPARKRIFSRNDFVNPQDIDWMFGVQDFSKVRINKSQVQ